MFGVCLSLLPEMDSSGLIKGIIDFLKSLSDEFESLPSRSNLYITTKLLPASATLFYQPTLFQKRLGLIRQNIS